MNATVSYAHLTWAHCVHAGWKSSFTGRNAREAIVTFPNFGHWPLRLQILRGEMPRSDDLPYEWYNTPNVHLCTITDFERFCSDQKLHVLERIVLHNGERIGFLPNLRGSLAVFRFERGR